MKEQITKITQELDRIEQQIREAIVQKIRTEKEPYDREVEKLTDRLVFLGAWIKDTATGISCPRKYAGCPVKGCCPNPGNDCDTYRRSTLRKVRKALNYER